MNFTLLLISIILLSYTPGQCQGRNPWRGARQGSRRHTHQEERVRGIRTPPMAPNYNPVPNKVLPIATPCQHVEPPCSKQYELPQVYQNLVKIPEVPNINLPVLPNVECAQNIAVSPNLQIIQPSQIVPNSQPMPVPNVQIQAQNLPNSQPMPVPNVQIQAQNLPNLQYVQNVQIPSVPLIQEPVLNVPLLEVPSSPPRKMRMEIPYPSIDPLERFSYPSPLVSPYLPAASPVSALSPPCLTPPTTCQPRNHFLRKIPIPPPTL